MSVANTAQCGAVYCAVLEHIFSAELKAAQTAATPVLEFFKAVEKLPAEAQCRVGCINQIDMRAAVAFGPARSGTDIINIRIVFITKIARSVMKSSITGTMTVMMSFWLFL